MQLEFGSYVYFIRAIEQDLLKIGSSGNPYSRISHLGSRYKWKLILVGAMPGDFSEEATLHYRFKGSGALVFGREWYRYSMIAAEIEALLPPGDARFPRKLTKEEILLRAELRWAPSKEERDLAGRILVEQRRSNVSAEEAKKLVAENDYEKRVNATMVSLYGKLPPGRRPI